MTKEQEEIINRLSKITNRQILYGNKCGITIEGFRELQEDIDTVLNILKEKDKLYHKALGDLVKADRENIQLKKQIDLMAETIRKLAISLANYKGSYNKETINFTGNIKDIKKYFERKVKDGRL